MLLDSLEKCEVVDANVFVEPSKFLLVVGAQFESEDIKVCSQAISVRALGDD
jgi:hypothetical protein